MTLFRKKYYTLDSLKVKKGNEIYKLLIYFDTETELVDEKVKEYKNELKKFIKYAIEMKKIEDKLPFKIKKVLLIKF